MNSALIPLLLAGLVLCALSAGCTSPTSADLNPLVTQSPPATASATPTTGAAATPQQIETLPARADHRYPGNKGAPGLLASPSL